MLSLTEILNDASRRAGMVSDCGILIDDEVSAKSGLSGIAIKTAYKAVKGIRPGFIEQVVEHLLPEFASVLDPICEKARAASQPVSTYFSGHPGEVADALLSITDAKAKQSSNGLVKGAYEKLRGSAKKNVEAAVPRLARLVQKYYQDGGEKSA